MPPAPSLGRRRWRLYPTAATALSLAAACSSRAVAALGDLPAHPPRPPVAVAVALATAFVPPSPRRHASAPRTPGLVGGGGGAIPAAGTATAAVPGRRAKHPRLRVLLAETSGTGDDATSAVAVTVDETASAGGEQPVNKDAGPLEAGDDDDDGGDEDDEREEERNESDVGSVDESSPSAFRLLGRLAIRTLVKSDIKRIECNDGASAGWTAWVDQPAAEELQEALNSVELAGDVVYGVKATATATEEALLEIDEAERAEALERRDEARRWTRWMKSAPEPVVLDLSGDLREIMDDFVTDEELQSIDSARSDLLSRAGLRLHLLPSGSTLSRPLRNPTGTMVYGKLFYGGVTRFRQLSGGRFGTPRRAGERTVIHNGGTEDGADEGWLQYGGPERNYESVDMGPCALIELIILPTGLTLPPAISTDDDDSIEDVGGTTIDFVGWNSSVMFGVRPPSSGNGTQAEAGKTSAAGDASEAGSELAGSERNDYLRGTLTTAVGGLRSQVDAIVRRVLDGRAVRAVAFDDDGDGGEELGGSDHASAMEAAELAALGLNPVRGLLLYGPPGCGKTALARELSKALHARPPKIVAAPELLDRWVGGSEKLVRYLFADAEEELKACGGDASKSALHVVVIDEIDAVFRRRTASKDSGEATRASAVNQILAKLDGVEQIPNILLIGMTNRRELLDEALLRPGRLEVQMEIPLPDQVGRREILQIHFEALRERGLLSQPLCKVIDGVGTSGALSDSDDTTSSGRRKLVPRALRYARTKLSLPRSRRMSDLAADGVTGGFSGADLAGLVRCAGSLALSRARQRGDGVDGLLITLEDVTDALEEVKQ